MPVNELTQLIAQKGDLAHLALFLWASSSSALLVWSLRELVSANRRFNIFVGEIANLNRLFKGKN